ncbi:MAG: hypothetical protein AAFX50_04730, partial [Acidobacteriota bacterium]
MSTKPARRASRWRSPWLLGPHDISAYFADEPLGFHLREYSHGDLHREARRAGFVDTVAVGRDGRPRPLWTRRWAERVL